MAADQRKKRPSGNSISGSTSELRKTKKKSLASLQMGIDMKPHISLELDSSQKRVVAKREQIGLSRRDLAAYSNRVSYYHKTLADVITLPKEIFASDNLDIVFSYEVWKDYLSEDERDLLSQFLPKGVDIEEVVLSLFEGSNFSFGNPVLRWSSMLASGDLHPDAIIQRDCSLLASQKSYCSKLQDYHNGMIRNILQLKEIWDGCQDPQEFVPNINRTLKFKSTFATIHEYKSQYSNQYCGGSSESFSGMENDKTCSSDDQAVMVMRSKELQKWRGLKLEKDTSPIMDIVDNQKDAERPRKGERLRNCNILVDGAKYMAYVRITKKQLELLKSLKQPGKCIQSKSVSHVLGDLSSYDIQPYVMFEEEERKKLHDQWLRVVSAVPQASADWRVRQTRKEQIAQLLYQDMKENAKPVLQVEECTGCMVTDQKCGGGTDPALNMEDDEDIVAALAAVQNTLPHRTVGGSGFQGNNVDMVGSVDDDRVQKMDFIPSSHEDSVMDMVSEDDAYSNDIRDLYTHGPQDFPCTSNPSFATLSRGDKQSAGGGSWQTAKLALSSHQSTSACEFMPDVSKVYLQSNLDCQPRFVNSESALHDNGTEPSMPYSLPNQVTFSAYQSDDRSGLASIFNNPELPSFKPQQNLPLPHFEQTQNVLNGNLRLPIQFQESLHQSHSLGVTWKRDEQYYLNQHLQNTAHDPSRSNTGFSAPVQEHLPPFHLPEWHTNSVGMSVPLQSQTHAGDFSTQNWYASGQQIHGGWYNPPNDASILNQGINDDSLFSVLSQSKELRSAASYNHHMGSTGQGMVGNIPRNNNVIPEIAHPLDFLRGREIPTSLPPNSMSWVNIPQQNSSMRDPMGKPFVRSWNQ
ncbi:hypothetical protein QQ045_021254 [Rhodiola kirilowii]